MNRNNLIKGKGERVATHFQDEVSRKPELKSKNESTTIRASIRAAEVIEDLKYTKRKKSALAALDEIIDVYLKYKHMEEAED